MIEARRQCRLIRGAQGQKLDDTALSHLDLMIAGVVQLNLSRARPPIKCAAAETTVPRWRLIDVRLWGAFLVGRMAKNVSLSSLLLHERTSAYACFAFETCQSVTGPLEEALVLASLPVSKGSVLEVMNCKPSDAKGFRPFTQIQIFGDAMPIACGAGG